MRVALISKKKKLARQLFNLTIAIALAAICSWTISCKQKETSEIEKIIVDEVFIESRIAGYDSVHIDTSGKSKSILTTYFLKDHSSVLVSRDSLKRIQAWWLRDSNGEILEGAEVSKTTGQILGKLHFVNGKIDGEVKYYYDDGRVRSKGQFKDGIRWGEWKNFDKDGNLTSTDRY